MKRKMSLNIFYLLGVLALLLLLTAGFAEEADEEVVDADTQSQEASARTENSSRSPNATFIPSEEISEDLPVSFPADI